MRAPHPGHRAVRHRLVLPAVALLAAVLTGCAGGSPEDGPTEPATGKATPEATTSESTPSEPATSEPTSAGPGPATPLHRVDGDGYSKGLRKELLAMLERDQAGRTGGEDAEGDQARTERLAEVVEQYGWPGWTLVREDGEDAAWAIAQHSDLDVAFQQEALALLEQAVADGDASPGNLAYLTDRVAANLGEPQTYGTQIGCDGGEVVPGPPLADPDAVDVLRAEVGLAPLDEYYEEELDGACDGVE